MARAGLTGETRQKTRDLRTRAAGPTREPRTLRGGRLMIMIAMIAACAPGESRSLPPSVRPRPPSFEQGRLTWVRSARMELSVPLPDAAAWVVDDSKTELLATHPATASSLRIAVLRADANVGRTQCETLARERRLVSSEPLDALEDEIAITQRTFDTRIEVGLEAVRPNAPLVGHVLAFGGFMHKCYAFDFSARVSDASDELELSARLAFARTRILPGLLLDAPTLGPGARRRESRATLRLLTFLFSRAGPRT